MMRLKASTDLDIEILQGKIKKTAEQAAFKSASRLARMFKDNISSGYVSPPMGANAIWQWLSDSYWKDIGMPTPAEHPGMVMTGFLLSSVKVEEIESTKYEVSVNAPYAVALEYGGTAPPRPYAEPAVLFFDKTNVVEKIVGDLLEKVFNDI